MNLKVLLDRAIQGYPGQTGVVCGGKRLTYRELGEKSTRLAAAMYRLGVRKGDRAAIYMGNCAEYVEMLFAMYRSGVVMVGINPRLSTQEACYILNNSGSKIVFVDAEHAPVLNSLRPEIPLVEHCISVGVQAPQMLSYDGLLADEKPVMPGVHLDEEDLALLFYTGGTTGRPKGVMLTHDNVIHAVVNMQADQYRIDQKDILFSATTIAHASGFRALLAAAKGASHVILEKFDPELVLQTVEKEKITVLSLIPTTLIMMLNYPHISKYDLSSVRMITYGASAMAVERLKEALKVFGNILVQVYGQTEAPMTISCLEMEDHILNGTEAEVRRVGSAGRPCTNVDVRIVDKDGKDMPTGERGEIIVRGPHVMKGYWKDPEMTAQTLKDGWLYTGDVAWQDEQGFLYIVDRVKDMIITGGYNVYPREIEEVLYAHPAVLEAAVIGVPDDLWGEAIKAVVVLKEGFQTTEKEIIDYCAARLAKFKKPKGVDFLPALPKTGIGKISKRDIRDRYWVGRDRKV